MSAPDVAVRTTLILPEPIAIQSRETRHGSGRRLPAVTVVGLGDTAVLQARDRIRAAFGNAGFDWPDRRVTVSLPPSDLPKHGPGFDLPIAIGLLNASWEFMLHDRVPP